MFMHFESIVFTFVSICFCASNWLAKPIWAFTFPWRFTALKDVNAAYVDFVKKVNPIMVLIAWNKAVKAVSQACGHGHGHGVAMAVATVVTRHGHFHGHGHSGDPWQW